MNWDAVGAMGEIIGAGAVVISVVYLAVQIRKQTQDARLQATQELSAQGQHALDLLITNPEMVPVYAKAVQDYNSLPNDDRLWAAILFQRIFRVVEQQLLHIDDFNADQDYIDSFQRSFFEALTFPGVQQWWETSNNLFSERFQAYVNKALIDAKAKGYNSTFKSKTDETN